MIIGELDEMGFEVVSAEEMNKHPMAFLPMFEVKDVMKIGSDMRARWVLSGSITQVGQKISLDLRGVDAHGEKAPFSIFVVEDDMDRLEVAAEKAASGVYNQVVGVIQIDSIKVEGNKRIDKEAILAAIQSKEGDKLDQDVLDKDLRTIYKMGYFTDVNIDVEDAKEGKVVIFKVAEKPSIGSIVFSGNREFDDDDLKEEIGIKTYAILNRSEVTQSVNRLREFYKQKGYYNARIEETIKDMPGNEVALTYSIQEGEKVYITHIEFEGNEKFDDDELADLMETSEKGLLSWFTKSGVLDNKMLEFDLHKITAFYHNHGYIKARTGEPQISYIEGDGLKITTEIIEGPQYGVDVVDVDGDLIKEREALLEIVKIQEEDFFNREVVRKDAIDLRELYANEGYAYAKVDPSIVEDDETRTVDITYKISMGPQVTFERINITGNDMTRDKVIRRELKAIEGETYSHESLKRGTENLHRLGFFEEVDVQTEKGSSEEQMVVNVAVKERPTGSFSIGAGYSSYDKSIGTVSVSESNLFGFGQRLKLSARISSKTQEFDIRFTEPWFMDRPISAGVDLYKWSHEYWDYTKDSLGGALRFRFPIGIDEDFTRGNIKYAFEDADLTDIDNDAATVIQDMAGRNVKSSITLGIDRDSKDRPFLTTKGSYNAFSYEYAGGLFGGDSSFTKIMVNSAWYFPGPWETVLLLRGQWGYAKENSDGKLPLYEKFYLGGIDSVRGFKTSTISPEDPETGDRIGGEKMMAYSIECRVPVIKEQGVVGVIFYDTGNAYRKDDSYSFGDLRKAAGVGVRWYSPFGPLRIEYGRKLDRRDDEESGNWEFSMGGTF
jgi:outer membrane protein insertion porin family